MNSVSVYGISNQPVINQLQKYQASTDNNCIRMGEVHEGGDIRLREVCSENNISSKGLGTFQVGGVQLAQSKGSHLLFFDAQNPIWIINNGGYPMPLLYQDDMDVSELERLYRRANGESLRQKAPDWVRPSNQSGVLADSMKYGAAIYGTEALTLLLSRVVVSMSVSPEYDRAGWDAVWNKSFLSLNYLENVITSPVIEEFGFRVLLQGTMSKFLLSMNLMAGCDLPAAYRRAKTQSRVIVALITGAVAYAVTPKDVSGTYSFIRGLYSVFINVVPFWNVYEKHGLAGSYMTFMVAALMQHGVACGLRGVLEDD